MSGLFWTTCLQRRQRSQNILECNDIHLTDQCHPYPQQLAFLDFISSLETRFLDFAQHGVFIFGHRKAVTDKFRLARLGAYLGKRHVRTNAVAGIQVEFCGTGSGGNSPFLI